MRFLKESVSIKKIREKLNEGFRGCKDVQIIDHGAYSDPELTFTDGDKTYKASYWDVEDSMRDYYREEYGYAQTHDDDYAKELNATYTWKSIEDENDDEDFNKFCANHEDAVKSDIMDMEWHAYDESLNESDNQEKHIFYEVPDDEIPYDMSEFVFEDDGLFGKDGKDGLIIDGHGDFTTLIYSQDHEDEINELLHSYYDSDEIVEELKKITGKNYIADQFRGYSQSDWVNVYYPEGEFSDEWITYLSDAYMGCYYAYRSDDGELVFITDSDKRNPKQIIADDMGYEPSQIILKKFTGYTKTPNYEDDIDESLNEDIDPDKTNVVVEYDSYSDKDGNYHTARKDVVFTGSFVDAMNVQAEYTKKAKSPKSEDEKHIRSVYYESLNRKRK